MPCLTSTGRLGGEGAKELDVSMEYFEQNQESTKIKMVQGLKGLCHGFLAYL